MSGKNKRKKQRHQATSKPDATSMDSREEQEKPRTRESQPEEKNTNSNSKKLSKWWREPAHTIQAIGILIGTIVAVIYGCQLQQMIESNRVNREALQSVQRAFVNPSVVSEENGFSVNDEHGLDGIILQIKLENTGATPAKTVTSHLTTSNGPFQMTDHWKFDDQWPESDHKHVHPVTVLDRELRPQ